ncbi:hypothetical protein GIB67_025687 [Kingdonia uniflora]|uniref:Uncharacterized protein n=1 Tax=Kingdonia uniflora TaxID=39325 RepID=A0A7J7M591_9MAGN|nr:hypothetical protein GIB67_025687 [Kingdonia uniflora]
MEFTKGYLARVQEEVDDFLKANPEEVTDLEGDENLSTTKVGEVTNQDLAGNPGGSNQEFVRATTNVSKRSLNSKVTTSSHAHEQHVDENVEPVMSHVQPNVYNEAEVLTVLEWASKQGVMMQDELVGSVLPGLQ